MKYKVFLNNLFLSEKRMQEQTELMRKERSERIVERVLKELPELTERELKKLPELMRKQFLKEVGVFPATSKERAELMRKEQSERIVGRLLKELPELTERELKKLPELMRKQFLKTAVEIEMNPPTPEQIREVKERAELERLEQLRMKDSWVRRLRLEEGKGILRGSVMLAVTIASIMLIGSIGVYLDILTEFLTPPLATGIGAAVFLWLLISYGDHGLRKIRVRNDWYGGNAMEVDELLRFIKKAAEDNGGDGSPPRRLFQDDELIIRANADKERIVPSGIGAC